MLLIALILSCGLRVRVAMPGFPTAAPGPSDIGVSGTGAALTRRPWTRGDGPQELFFARKSANSLMQWMKSNLVSYFYTYVG